MTPNEQAMWRDIAETIEPYCVNGGGFIRKYFEDAKCEGFVLRSFVNTNELAIDAMFIDAAVFPIEEIINDSNI